MTNSEENLAYQAYIKDIWLELPGYDFDHENTNERFVGRGEVEEELLGYLKNGKGNGAYLITGYRGMGKTLFVNKTIKKYKKEVIAKTVIQEIKINFGQKNLQEIDILRQIVKGLRDNLLFKTKRKKIGEFFHKNFFSFKGLPFLVSVFFLLLVASINWSQKNEYVVTGKWFSDFIPADNINTIESYGLIAIVAIIISIILMTIAIAIKNVLFPLGKVYDDLDALYSRCQSEVEEEAGVQGAGEKFPFGIVHKQTKRYPIANPKEVEKEIIDILYKIRDKKYGPPIIKYFFSFLGYIPIVNHILPILPWNRRRKEFVFIFDEIDKVDPFKAPENYYEDMDSFEKHPNHSQKHDYRERKRMVIDILASLKYLITTAEAKFIFIAGREMFDAALADIADRQSAIGSIFHQVINVDSFLKDKEDPERTSGTTSIVEAYLETILLNKKYFPIYDDNIPETQKSFLTRYYESLLYTDKNIPDKLTKEARLKIIYTLQYLIIYLTYRSNGSPKKLVRLIEDMVKKEPAFLKNEKWTWWKFWSKKYAFTGWYFTEDNKNIVICHKPIKKEKKQLEKYFIKIDHKNQYRLGFINYLYQPLLISFGLQRKSLSDKMLVSTTFLMDHIIKFHPFAFSIQNLELVPEVISEARSPELRYFIEDLVSFLRQNHVRDTEIGLFEYKFINKTFSEITYLCKLFEDESAAFNFTLDENYQVKSHLRNMIKELRSIYKSFRTEGKTYINSISFLNEQLGDCAFFDQEYDDAVIAYSDAIQSIEVDDQVDTFIMRLKLKLKLGHTYEKMKAFEIALGTFIEITRDIRDFIKNPKFNRAKIISKNGLLQIIIQPYIAKLFLTEKLSVVGVTLDNILKIKEELNYITEKLCHEVIGNDIISSNHNSYIGTLLFYKNFTIDTRAAEILKNIENENKVFQINLFLLEFNQSIRKSYIKSHTFNAEYRTSELTYVYYKLSLFELAKRTHCAADANISLIDLLCQFEMIVAVNLPTALVGNKCYIKFKNKKIVGSESYDSTYLKNIAIALYKMGDCLFSNITTTQIDINESNRIIKKDLFSNLDNGKHAYWSFFDFYVDNEDSSENNIMLDDKVSSVEIIQLVFCIYFWSAQFYLRAGKPISASFQYRKIMDVARNVLSPDTVDDYLSLFEKYFFANTMQIIDNTHNTSSRFQINKQKYYTGMKSFQTPLEYSKHHFLNTSTSPEVKEAILLLVSLKHFSESSKKQKYVYNDKEKDFYRNLTSPYVTISSQYIRIKELHLQYKLHRRMLELKFVTLNQFITTFWININKDENNFLWNEYSKNYERLNDWEAKQKTFKQIFLNVSPPIENLFSNQIGKSTDENRKELKSNIKEVFQIVAGSIHCLRTIISIMNNYGIGYFMSYSELGDYHRRLGNYMKYYEFCKFIYNNFLLGDIISSKEKEFDITVIVGDLLQGDIIYTIDSTSQYQLAIQNYYKAKQLHTDGGTYKSNIMNMFYLEDDFSDSLYHFFLSRERQKINSGELRKNITFVGKQIKSSKLFEFNSYVNEFVFPPPSTGNKQ